MDTKNQGSAKIIVIILALVVVGVLGYVVGRQWGVPAVRKALPPVSVTESELEKIGLGLSPLTSSYFFDFTGDGNDDVFAIRAEQAGSDASIDFYALTKDGVEDVGCGEIELIFGKETQEQADKALQEVRNACVQLGIKIAFHSKLAPVVWPEQVLRRGFFFAESMRAGRPLLFSRCGLDHLRSHPDDKFYIIGDDTSSGGRDCGTFELRWLKESEKFIKTDLDWVDGFEKYGL